MKTKTISTILMTLGLGVFSATVATAQGLTPPTSTTPDAAKQQMTMEKEPNHVLATAYHQNLVLFADALNGQAVGASVVNVEFARAAVTEMRRGFDKMAKYHEDYMKTISAEVRSSTTAMMQTLETQRADLNVQLTALEKEVALSVPDAKKVATMTAGIHTQLDTMSMNQGGSASKVTLKY